MSNTYEIKLKEIKPNQKYGIQVFKNYDTKPYYEYEVNDTYEWALTQAKMELHSIKQEDPSFYYGKVIIS
ncbi:MAG: hypothetical protein LIR50_19200 [Bacillota bacterium]|nr:hypothetical protein [Bacillota bacterium]